MKKILGTLLMAIASFAVKAQIPQPDHDTTAKHFLIVASIGNLQEKSSGQLAELKSKRGDVKSFGRMMVSEHGNAEQQLLNLAKKEVIDLSPAATGGIQPDLNLKNAGDRFDQLYVHAMVSGHRSTLATFQNYALTGKNPAVREFAEQMLPILKAHLAAILVIEKQMEQ